MNLLFTAIISGLGTILAGYIFISLVWLVTWIFRL